MIGMRITIFIYYNVNPFSMKPISMVKLKITSVGHSSGVIIPKDLLARINAKKGDWIQIQLEGLDKAEDGNIAGLKCGLENYWLENQIISAVA